tara:strand:- start:102 stop:485 length:384 start_codon:yes stop_codon:yes gene_type:complete
MKNHIHLEGVIEKGKISYPIKANQTKLNNFLANTPEGARVEIFISVNDGKGSNAQLARIHAMCRQMANDIGYTFEEMKLQIKRKAGLCFMKNNTEYCRSFAKCDAEELNLAIQACIEIGDFAGINLR